MSMSTKQMINGIELRHYIFILMCTIVAVACSNVHAFFICILLPVKVFINPYTYKFEVIDFFYFITM